MSKHQSEIELFLLKYSEVITVSDIASKEQALSMLMKKKTHIHVLYFSLIHIGKYIFKNNPKVDWSEVKLTPFAADAEALIWLNFQVPYFSFKTQWSCD